MVSGMNSLVAVVAAGLGVAVGPVLRLEAFRSSVPAEAPRRVTCPHCDAAGFPSEARWRDFARLPSGRCRQCGLPLGPLPAVVEVAAAVSFAALTLTVDDVLPLLAYGWVAAVGIVLAVVDIAVHRLPNRLTALLAAGATAALAVQALIAGAGHQLIAAMGAGVGAALFYLLMSLLTSGDIGLGDAKLAFGLGVVVGWNGWPAVVFAMMLGLLLTGVTAVALLVLKRARRKDSIPHGPFMVLATVTTIVLTQM